MTVLNTLLVVTATLFASTTFAQSSPIRMNLDGEFSAGRVWLDCSFGSCMIDTGGNGHMVAVSPEFARFPVVGHQEIDTVQGPQTCDVLAVQDFSLASKAQPATQLLRCAILPVYNSPMIGLPAFLSQRFEFSFSRMEFSWLDSELPVSSPVVRRGQWFAMNIQLGAISSLPAIFDTGAPLTLVDEAFFRAHRDFFEPETQVYRGRTIARVKAEMLIDGLRFRDLRVMVLDLKGAFGPDAPEVFLGMNHIREMNWRIDLKDFRFFVWRE